MISFKLPQDTSSIIKVIGMGGEGSSAIETLIDEKVEGVNFIVATTDEDALKESHAPNKVKMTPNLKGGWFGDMKNPIIGRQPTDESLEEIKKILEENTKMVFITAGMGDSNGAADAPSIAKICKELGILTVGIVTSPYSYEGNDIVSEADKGIADLKKYVDTLLIIDKNKLDKQYGDAPIIKEAFAKADSVLSTAVKCITDVINSTGQVNVDFADVCTVMSNGGVAILGNATAEGENRALKAIEEALDSPTLAANDIRGAKWILININSAEGEYEFSMDEVEVIQNYLLTHAGEDTDVILGLGYDNTKGKAIGITLIATGFPEKQQAEKTGPVEIKKVERLNLLEKSSNDLELAITQSEPEKFSVNIFLKDKPLPYLLITHLNKLYNQLVNKLKTSKAPPEKTFFQKIKALFKSSGSALEEKESVGTAEEPKNLLSEIVSQVNQLMINHDELSIKIGPVILIKQLEEDNDYDIILKKISPQLSDKLNKEPKILMDFNLLKSLINQ